VTIKKLDKLILKAFIGPFLVTFFLAFFVLVMQKLWVYVDDLVGKGLDFFTIGKFLWYAGASLLTLSMPIAILISSIMTFGNLGENFQLVAIKSSGISLLRFMRPLIWVSILLCGVTFLFANYVIPYANLEFKTLYYDIGYKKPALDFKTGSFYKEITGYSIKIGKKDDDGKTLHNVVIFEQSNGLQDNCIIAEKGVVSSSNDKNMLEFTLYNGTRYEEDGAITDSNTDYSQLAFKQYKKLFDLTGLQMMNTSDSTFKNDSKMFSVHQLNKAIDSSQRLKDSIQKRIIVQADAGIRYLNPPDSIWNRPSVQAIAPGKINDEIPDSLKSIVFTNSIGSAYSIKGSIEFPASQLDSINADILQSNIEWHRKFALSFSCLILFFIGAPLGSIIRKGGFGMPLVFAIIFFLVFHLLNVFGEKFAKDGTLSAFTGMWLSVICLTPVGAFLTYKAMNDSQLFNKEFYLRPFRKLRSLILQKK
jgi:lipopolysaccharide export system permease protein